MSIMRQTAAACVMVAFVLTCSASSQAAEPEEVATTAVVRWSGSYAVSMRDEEATTKFCDRETRRRGAGRRCGATFRPGVLSLRLVGADSGFDQIVHVELPPGDNLLTLTSTNQAAMIATVAGLSAAVLGAVLFGVGIDNGAPGAWITGITLMPVGSLVAIIGGAVWASDRSVTVHRETLAPRPAVVGVNWGGAF